MWTDGHDAYLESRVLTADPIELVNLLYQACTEAVRGARHHLAEGRILERSREINKAYEIVVELATSLDHERGGEISQRLALLYDYMQRSGCWNAEHTAERRAAGRGSGPVIHTLRGMGGHSKAARSAISGKPLVATGRPGNWPRSRAGVCSNRSRDTIRERLGYCKRGRLCSLQHQPVKDRQHLLAVGIDALQVFAEGGLEIARFHPLVHHGAGHVDVLPQAVHIVSAQKQAVKESRFPLRC